MLPKPLRRGLTALAATRPGAKVYKAVLPPLDAAVKRATDGRRTFTELVLPCLLYTSDAADE